MKIERGAVGGERTISHGRENQMPEHHMIVGLRTSFLLGEPGGVCYSRLSRVGETLKLVLRS